MRAQGFGDRPGDCFFWQQFANETFPHGQANSARSLERANAAEASANVHDSINSVNSANSLAFIKSDEKLERNFNSLSLDMGEDAHDPQGHRATKHAFDPGAWSEKEDKLLFSAVQYSEYSWEHIAASVPGRTPQECTQRWERYVKPRSHAQVGPPTAYYPSSNSSNSSEASMPVSIPLPVQVAGSSQGPAGMQTHSIIQPMELPTPQHTPVETATYEQSQSTFDEQLEEGARIRLRNEMRLQMEQQLIEPVKEDSIPSLEVLTKMLNGEYIKDADKLTISGEFQEKALASKQWPEELDKKLLEAIEHHGAKNWKTIAVFVDGKTDSQCQQRWKKVLDPALKKGLWSAEEDATLIKMMGKMSSSKEVDWSAIADAIPGRLVKQCKERWKCNLDPSLKKGAWSAEETSILIRKHKEYGNKWRKLSAFIPGRSENDIKMHHKSLMSQMRKQMKKAWPPEDEARLMKLCAEREKNTWESISRKFPYCSQGTLKKHAEKLQKLQSAWTPEQDAALAALYVSLGESNWETYAMHFPWQTIYTIRSRVEFLKLSNNTQFDCATSGVGHKEDYFEDLYSGAAQQSSFSSVDEVQFIGPFEDGLELDGHDMEP